MAIASGMRLGPYEIHSAIGAGGMGEVYRARDTRLGRDVAIKVLPDVFLSDPERLARFEREARALASLNHPHIAAIYGVEEAGDVRGLVLELVEGPTLADRVRSGPVPVREALAIAGQIADALDAAHERGIIHRDLKPANIKVTPDGSVKVLDFGLARICAPESPDSQVPHEPAMTETATRLGTILGTAAYMSPEQARGHATDRRADVWAFGCVLFEMLTGRSPFAGENATDTIAAIIEREPDWTRLPADTPQGIRRLLRRCLNKELKQRLRDFADIRLDLADAQGADIAPGAAPTRTGRRTILVWATVIAVVAFGLVAILRWGGFGDRTITSPSTVRTTVTVPAAHELDTSGSAAPLALSPNGRRLVYAALAGGRALLYVRDLDEFEARPLSGTEGARYPSFSPDGEWVAFFSGGKLKRIPLSGGAPIPICDAPVIGRGATWGTDGTIIFDPGPAGLMRVSAMGGRPVPVTSLDAKMDARNLSWPHFLPDARAVLVTVGPELIAEGSPSLAALSLDSGQWHELGPGSQAQFVQSGHLVYHAVHVREGEVHVVGFDVRQFAVRGAPVSVVDSVFRARNGGAAYFATAGTDTLVYAPGGLAHTLVRVDRQGRRTPLSEDRRGFRFPRLSPDGGQVAVTIDPRPSQVWIYDVVRRSSIPLATDGHNMAPAWTPDGQRLSYSSRADLYWRVANANGAAERLLVRDGAQYPGAWTRDGRSLIFQEEDPVTSWNVWLLPLGSQPRLLVGTPASEQRGTLSPDDRWMAYTSDESGRVEAYVRPFPNADGGKWMISTAGGHSPVWSRDGRELFFMNGTSVFAVTVDGRGPAFVASAPVLLFSGPFDATQDQNYDVFPNGDFVMVETDPNARPTHVQVVLNWFEDVRRRLPSN